MIHSYLIQLGKAPPGLGASFGNPIQNVVKDFYALNHLKWFDLT